MIEGMIFVFAAIVMLVIFGYFLVRVLGMTIQILSIIIGTMGGIFLAIKSGVKSIFNRKKISK